MPRPSSGKLRLVGVLIVVLIALPSGYGLWSNAQTRVYTDNAYIRGDIVAVAPKVSGYIAEVAVNDNQLVEKGDVLLRIDHADHAARVRQAKAALAAATAARLRLDEERQMQTVFIDEAHAMISAAQAEADRAGKDLHRTNNLIADGWVPAERLEVVTAIAIKARAGHERASAGLRAQEQKLRVLDAQSSALDAAIEQAAAQLQLAEISLSETTIRATERGFIGNLHAEPGQYARPGAPLLSVVSNDHKWVVANFKETQLGRIEPGQTVSIRVDSFQNLALTGRVESIAPASGAEFSLLPPDNATGNFIRVVQRIPVKIELDRQHPLFHRLRPGMSAAVSIETTRLPHGGAGYE
ncbi:Membrane fusion component of tripartite multidrug resistance system [Tritonibacter mobilis]|nr:Membrane fusion component of tripartite multidrug resistance system [Tritonibacter mobilis]